jgi:hypothetical protein
VKLKFQYSRTDKFNAVRKLNSVRDPWIFYLTFLL